MLEQQSGMTHLHTMSEENTKCYADLGLSLISAGPKNLSVQNLGGICIQSLPVCGFILDMGIER